MNLDQAYSENLFLVLGKYVQRQDENLFTQALVLLFNRVHPFRRAFLKLLQGRSGLSKIEPESVIAHAQVGRRVPGKRVLVDMEIWRKEDKAPLFLIESKLDAGLGVQQIKNYKRAIDSLPKKTCFVMLTKHGVEDALWKHVPKNTISLSWSLVVQIAQQSAKQAARLDQLLLRDFVTMTKLKGVDIVPSMTKESFGRLRLASSFVLGKSKDMDRRTIASLDIAMKRLEEHRESTWGRIFSKKRGWNRYQVIRKWQDPNCACLLVGFSRPKPRRWIAAAHVVLALACTSRPTLSISWGWRYSQSHPKWARGDSTFEDDMELTGPSTRQLFQMAMPQAIAYIEKEMRLVARRLVRTGNAGKWA